jgi:hypothetical protein
MGMFEVKQNTLHLSRSRPIVTLPRFGSTQHGVVLRFVSFKLWQTLFTLFACLCQAFERTCFCHFDSSQDPNQDLGHIRFYLFRLFGGQFDAKARRERIH